MKTKEELSVLKKEVEALNKKLTELSDEELLAVAGGFDGEDGWVANPGDWCVGPLLRNQMPPCGCEAKSEYRITEIKQPVLMVKVYYFCGRSYRCSANDLILCSEARQTMKPGWAFNVPD